MKITKLALAVVVSCGMLSACKPEPAAPVAEVPAPMAAEPAATEVVPEPAVPTDAAPAATDAAAVEEDEDSPHSGGDKVGTGTGPGH